MEDGRPLTNRLLARLPFVRTSLEETTRPSPSDSRKSPPTSPPAIRRRRKGSLRKALLTTGHIVAASSRRAGDYARPSVQSASPEKDAVASIESSHGQTQDRYGSTTDEDTDVLTMRQRSSSGSYQPLSQGPTSGPSSRRKSMRLSGPLPVLTGGTPVLIDELAPATALHDYAETEWWGWIILIVTWIVFVVGMGSCLEVWSWAWDVGETPYAPPELEDDATLPIVGYYPALIIMTGVMAWAWVMVAWVGMKYFRHAKVWDGEDY